MASDEFTRAYLKCLPFGFKYMFLFSVYFIVQGGLRHLLCCRVLLKNLKTGILKSFFKSKFIEKYNVAFWLVSNA